MKTISLDLRQGIVAAYNEANWTQEEVAKRFPGVLGDNEEAGAAKAADRRD